MTEYAPAKTGEYLSNVLQFSKDFACCENIWRMINTIASIWHEKYARTFVRGHYLFLEAHSVLRTSLSKTCSLLGTENVRGQLSEHIFASKEGYYLFIKKFLLWLTRASLTGCWAPETSRNVHYWQPALRWRSLPRNRAMSPHVVGKTGTHHTELTVERGREGRENAWIRAPMQTTLTVCAIAVKGCQHTSHWSRSLWSPGACTCPNTADQYGNAGAIKLRSIAFNCI